MDPDQTCCSGYFLTCSAYLPEFSLAVTARNHALAEKRNLDIYTFCNGCYADNREFAHLLGDQKTRDTANQLIGRFGYNYQARTGIYHVQELYYRLKERIAEKVVYPLKGLSIAAHYGCHYLLQEGVIDDFDLPSFHEEILRMLEQLLYLYRREPGAAMGWESIHPQGRVGCLTFLTNLPALGMRGQLITMVCPAAMWRWTGSSQSVSNGQGRVPNTCNDPAS